MAYLLILTIALGILSGLYVFPVEMLQHIEQWISWGLWLMLFFVGIEIGQSKEAIKKLRVYGWKVILLPLSIGIGSVVGALAVSYFVKLPIWEAAAVGAGMGWYSLSGIILDQLHSTQLGTIAFLANVSRELLAILLIPIITKYTNNIIAIAPAGATSMDSTLPIIAKYTSPEITALAFISGAILTALIPFLVPFFIQFA